MNGPFRVSAFQSGRKALESLIEIRKRNQQAQKNRLKGRFIRLPDRTGGAWKIQLGARGRLELRPVAGAWW